MKCKLRNTKGRRQKNFWGAVVGGAIGALGSLVGSKLSGDSSVEAARAQAQAIKDAAIMQSQAIEKQTEANSKLQKESMDLNKELHQQDVDMQNRLQTNLQLMAGAQSTVNRKRANKITFKHGGIVQNSLYDKAPYEVIDGGYALPLGVAQDGMYVSELIGNDHEHSHKTKNGTRKTGVGIKLQNGKVIEGEGNQNTNTGELVATDGNTIIFLSKHTNKGFNPTQAVKQGMAPSIAGNIQERLKSKRVNSPVGKRKQAGWGTIDWYNLGAAGINSLGNIGSALISSSANKKAAGILSSANAEAANMLSNAYNNLKTIDMDEAIKDSDYEAATVMPAIVNPYISNRAEINEINRAAARQNRFIRRNSLSAASAANRMSEVEDAAQMQRAKSYEQVRNENARYQAEAAKTITQASIENAKLKQQAAQSKSNARLSLLQYNNQIQNQRILGSANALANSTINTAQINANAATQNAQAWGNAVASIGNNFGGVFSAYGTRQHQENLATIGADPVARANYVVENGNDADILRGFENSRVGSEAWKIYGRALGKDVDNYNQYTTTNYRYTPAIPTFNSQQFLNNIIRGISY